MQTYRAFINQPSTLQDHHKHHGKRCIVQDTGASMVTVWFTEGAIHSMMIDRLAVSRLNISSAQD